jgi:hypothetical protein
MARVRYTNLGRFFAEQGQELHPKPKFLVRAGKAHFSATNKNCIFSETRTALVP